jgi:hypothetical protein
MVKEIRDWAIIAVLAMAVVLLAIIAGYIVGLHQPLPCTIDKDLVVT